MRASPGRGFLIAAGVVLLMAIAVAALAPAAWQIRLGLNWLVEHFLAYFAVTTIFCLAWPRPMAVAALLVPFAVLLEALQGLTPDRTPDLPTMVAGVSAIIAAAVVMQALRRVMKLQH